MQKKLLFEKCLLKTTSFGGLITILLVIYVFLLSSSFLITYVERFNFDFKDQRSSSNKTVVIIHGTSEPAVLRVAEYLGRHLDSFYVRHPFYYLLNDRCPIENEFGLFEHAVNCDYINARKTLTKTLEKKRMGCNGQIHCILYYRMNLFNKQLRCSSKVKQNTIVLNYPSPEILSKICRNSSLLLIQSNRVCNLENLKNIVEKSLNQTKVNFKILHVVEDPRSHIFDAVLEKGKKVVSSDAFIKATKSICQKLSMDLDFIKKYWKKTNWSLRNKIAYMRMTIEEFIFQFPRAQIRLKQFIGSTDSTDMKCILEKRFKKLLKNEIEVEPHQEPLNWRKMININDVVAIQNVCRDVFDTLPYVQVYYKEDLIDTNNIDLF